MAVVERTQRASSVDGRDEGGQRGSEMPIMGDTEEEQIGDSKDIGVGGGEGVTKIL